MKSIVRVNLLYEIPLNFITPHLHLQLHYDYIIRLAIVGKLIQFNNERLFYHFQLSIISQKNFIQQLSRKIFIKF